jgi:hypothetical protein
MVTDNPKVSAYVPQTLKDRLKEFRAERDNISESQAVTIILAEYFQMPEVLGRSLEMASMGGVTLARMEALEEKLINFAASVEHRLQQLREEIRGSSRPLVVHQITPEQTVSESEQSSSLLSELQTIKSDELPTPNQDGVLGVPVGEKQDNSLLSEPLVEPTNYQTNENEKLETPELLDDGAIPSELGSELSKPNALSDEAGTETVEQVPTQKVETNSEVEKDLQNTSNVQQVLTPDEVVDSNESRPELSLSSESPNSLLSQPLSGKIMAKRLGYHPDSLSKVKTRSGNEAFIALSADRDPDKIAWQFAKTGRGYLPANELSSELQSKLLNWLKENFPNYSP